MTIYEHKLDVLQLHLDALFEEIKEEELRNEVILHLELTSRYNRSAFPKLPNKLLNRLYQGVLSCYFALPIRLKSRADQIMTGVNHGKS